ncbi:MAG: hypothetical protein KU38_07405 [Sulfurovum sp. FS08-3]|nr:MAG: hypothetical protein KU38_07405 [Sulfurovum sp. FS08-3]
MPIYLDNNTATTLDLQVKAFMDSFEGRENEYQPLRDAYERIYATLNASHEDTIIPMAQESMVVWGLYFQHILHSKKNHILTIKEQSLTKSIDFLQSKGVKVTYLPLNAQGVVEAHTVYDFITPQTAFVSIPWASGKSGAIFPIDSIAAMCQAKGVLFHSDATHAVGKIPISLKDTPVDYVSFRANTFHGPQGVGGLYMRQGKELDRVFWESNVNVAGVIGMGKAMELAFDAMDFELEDTKELRDRLEEALLTLPHTLSLTPQTIRTPHTLALAFEGVHGEAMLWDLGQAGIVASMGEKPNSVSFALSRLTTQEEIDDTIEALQKAVKRLRTISQGDNNGNR